MVSDNYMIFIHERDKIHPLSKIFWGVTQTAHHRVAESDKYNTSPSSEICNYSIEYISVRCLLFLIYPVMSHYY